MIFKTPAMRLSIVLILLMVNLLFLANLIGLVPDESESALDLRKSLSESLALQFSAAAEKGEFQTIQRTLRAIVERNENIRSAAIRKSDGKLIALAGEHLVHWKAPVDGKSTSTHVHVPVFRKNENWATVEIRFAPLWTNNLASGFANSFVGMLAFITLSGLLCYFLIIKKTLRELDPSTVIPERVQKAFDVLQEGVLILDEKEQTVMANRSFARLFGKTPAEMIGRKGSEMGWLDCQSQEQVSRLPWFKVLRDGKERKGASLSLRNRHGGKIKFAVNAAMVTDNAGKCRGTLVTFDDITQLEEKNFELSDLVEKLQLSQEEIQSKSQELEFLANRDPMTLCLNRRALGLKFDALFTQAIADGSHLSCLMVDIDFFKSVNDRYGHATGDQVIKAVADVLKSCTRDSDLVGRHGGEEFCVVLPQIHLDKAAQIGERIRRAIEKESCSGVNITASLGVSSLESKINKPDELIDQADKALYAAKKSGRNRVVTWGKDNSSPAEIDSEAETQEQDSPSEKSAINDSETKDKDQAKLRRRVLELEGLLKKRTLELEHYEMYDFKTGMPTRSLFEDRIGHEIARGKRKNYMVAVLSMAIDTIKRVHETLGIKAAEQLVKACGQRLNEVLRENIDMVAMIENFKGTSTISLINQTEFGILLTDINQVDHVTWVIKRLLDAFEKPFQMEGNEIYASAYIGVSIFPHDGQTVDELYTGAINACSYAQKLNGQDRYFFSSRNLNEMAVSQLQIENSLHEAIQNDEMQLHYQPKIEVATGRIAGFEGLLRWDSARLGFVPPDKFIPVAEQSGQMDAIGDWVLYTACQHLRDWMDMGLEVGSIAVNISGVQLRQQNLPNRIQNLLDKFNLQTHQLEIELTESSLVNTYDQSFAILKEIEEMGLRVTMDDFGTGYSSLSYLRNIPLSAIKIDRSFISDIDQDENADKLIASIISIAHGLGLEVVAEGVEEKYQADQLIALNCEYLQGYYFSRPVPQSEVADLLQKQPMVLTG
jgi:diguanylate cyclase (GGDEF)-like protein/PAS domain S-box-containing protein